MKSEVKTPVLVGIAVLALAILLFFGLRSMNNVGTLDHGQVPYTPGVPPFKETDQSKRGPGGSPTPAGSAGAPPPPSAQSEAPNAHAPNMPSNMGPPTLGNSPK